MLPPQVNIILLSATVPNTFEFADWVGRTKQKTIHVISTLRRPVPLEHFLFISTVIPPKLFLIVDREKRFVQDGYKKAWDAVFVPKEEKTAKAIAAKKAKQAAGQKVYGSTTVTRISSAPGSRNDRNTWSLLVNLLRKQNLLPTVIFTFSRKRCETYADTLANVDLLTSVEKSEVHVFAERSLTRVKGTDRELPQILRIKEMLSRGVGVHHSGLLPIMKEASYNPRNLFFVITVYPNLCCSWWRFCLPEI
jgi:antiviral helicase SKI2